MSSLLPVGQRRGRLNSRTMRKLISFFLSTRMLVLLAVLTSVYTPLARAGITPTAVQCSAIFSDTKPQPVDRFSIRLEFIRNTTAPAKSQAERVDLLASDDVRKAMMQLQALAKIYEASDRAEKEKSLFKDFRIEMKDVEGEVGDLGRVMDLYSRAQSVGVSKSILEKIDGRVQAKKKEAAKHFKDLGWLPDVDRRVTKLEKMVDDLDFRKQKKDAHLQIEAIISIIDEKREEIKGLGEYFSKSRFEEEELENGPHKMRRDLRWITTMIQSAEGIFTLSEPKPSSARERTLVSKYASSKYIQLAPTGLAPVVAIPLIYLAKLVTELGRLKDFKETQLDLARVLLDEGYAKSRDEAEEKALKVAIRRYGDIDVEKESRKLYKEYLEYDPLKELSKSLKAALED
jgi:hypothetical protein